jgi:hypothetical protein
MWLDVYDDFYYDSGDDAYYPPRDGSIFYKTTPGYEDGGYSQRKEFYVNSSMYVKYNTANHSLFSFKTQSGFGGKLACMPRLGRFGESITSETYPAKSDITGGSLGFMLDVVNANEYLKTPGVIEYYLDTLPIVDLKKTVSAQYGGDSDSALLSNV